MKDFKKNLPLSFSNRLNHNSERPKKKKRNNWKELEYHILKVKEFFPEKKREKNIFLYTLNSSFVYLI